MYSCLTLHDHVPVFLYKKIDSAYCTLYTRLCLLCIIYSTLPTVHYKIDSAYTVHYILYSAYLALYNRFSLYCGLYILFSSGSRDVIYLICLLLVVILGGGVCISLGFTPIHIFITLHSLCVHLGSYMYTVRT